MDFRTRLLLAATALAVIGYFALIYGGCALDARCHLRSCGGRHICGVIHDADGTQPRSSEGQVSRSAPWQADFPVAIRT